MTSTATQQTHRIYRLADLVVDPGRREVRRGNEVIELTGKSYDVLLALIDAAPDGLSLDELMDRVWRGTVVSPATISKRIELLRHALGDSSESPQYVALLRGHGYRLIPDVEEASASPRGQPRGAVVMAALAVVAVVALGLVWQAKEAGRDVSDLSIAVLPFNAISDDTDVQLFADGLTDELAHVLASDAGLQVSGRSSSYHFRNSDADSRTIGKALGVAHLLHGSIRRDGDRLRVTADLVDAHSGHRTWSAAYDRKMIDIISIQQDIAHNVADSLQGTLGSARAGPAIANDVAAIDPETYAIYLRAVSLSPYGKTRDLGEAQRLIETVTERAPGFAPGWNRFAAVHGRRLLGRDPGYDISPEQSLAIMRQAVARAVSIDPENAENFANLGGIAWVFELDAAKAAPLIERAVKLDPNDLDIIAFAAEFAKFIGQLDAALELEQLLVLRDPLCDWCRFRLAKSYMFAARPEAALREIETLRSMGEGYDWNYGVVLLMLGRVEDAIDAFEGIGDAASVFRRQGRVLALCSLEREDDAARALQEFDRDWSGHASLVVAKTYAWCGQAGRAFELLDQSIAAGPLPLQLDYLSPLLAPLRDDPRWQNLLRRIGRSDEQIAEIPFSLASARSSLDR